MKKGFISDSKGICVVNAEMVSAIYKVPESGWLRIEITGAETPIFISDPEAAQQLFDGISSYLNSEE